MPDPFAQSLLTRVYKALHVSNITNTLHGRGGTKATREGNFRFIVHDTSTIFVQREDADGRVELQGEEDEAEPEHSKVPDDDGDDEETSRQVYHYDVVD